MRIEITARSVTLTDDMRNHIERRFYFVLGRYSGRAKQVRIWIDHDNEPEGTMKTCRVSVQLAGLPTVIVTQTSDSLLAAVAIAAARAGRTVARRIERPLSSKPGGKQGERETEKV